ncbi:ABC transporter substrate-binding protein [Dongia sp.]|uniref:ABC transporter substrate-binding protein n=1 Tax=Dongia sp. TaxID=1977262 RepID=UPI003750D29B
MVLVTILATGLLKAVLPAPFLSARADSPAKSEPAESYIAGFFRATVETAVAPQSDEYATKAVKGLLLRSIRLDETARYMLGRLWPTDNNEAGSRFQADFQDFVAEAVTTGLRANPTLALEVKGSRSRDDGSTLVLSMLTLPSGTALPVDWLVIADPTNGTFQITDITVAGINAAMALRSMTEASLAETDIDGLIPSWRTALARHQQRSMAGADGANAPQ